MSELELALKEVDKLGGYRDLYGKLQADGKGKEDGELATVMRENLGLQR